MQITRLLKEQDKNLKARIGKIYKRSNAGHMFSYGSDHDFSQNNFKRIFKKLPSELANQYLQIVSEHYLLSSDQFSDIFDQTQRKLLQENALYLWAGSVSRFIPPQEAILALLPRTSLLPTLVEMSKTCLMLSLPKADTTSPKCQLVNEINRRHCELYHGKELTEEQLNRIIEQAKPFSALIGETSYFYCSHWEKLAEQLGVDLPSVKSQCDKDIFLGYIKALAKWINPLLHSLVLFCKNSNYDYSLIYNPVLRKAIQQHTRQLAKSRLSKRLQTISPLPVTTTVSKYTQLSHIDDRSLYIMIVLMLSWLESNRLSITQHEKIRHNDLQRFVKRLSSDPVLQEQYRDVIEDLFFTCFCYTAKPKKEGSKLSQWARMAQLSQAELLTTIRKGQAIGLSQLFVDFLKQLPQDQWIASSEAEALFADFLETQVLLTSRKKELLFDFDSQALHYQRAHGDLDLLIQKGKKIAFDNMLLVGLRRITQTDQEALPSTDSPLLMQGNLEIPIPGNIEGEKLFNAAKIFDIADLHTLRLSQDSVTLLSTNFSSLQDALTDIEKCLENSLPATAIKLLERTFKERTKVYYDGQCLYLYDPAALAEVRKLLPAHKIRSEVDGRLILLYDLEPRQQLIAKLVRNNIIVEQPETRSRNYYRWAV